MRGKQNLKRLEQRRRLPGALQHFANFLFVPVRHGGNDGFLIFEVTVDQADADPSFSTNIVHAGLVKSPLGKANQSGIKDLGTSIGIGRFYLGLRHKFGKMNERSFIVNPARRPLSLLIYFRGDMTNRSIGPPSLILCIAPAVATPLGGRSVGLPSDRPQTGGYGSC